MLRTASLLCHPACTSWLPPCVCGAQKMLRQFAIHDVKEADWDHIMTMSRR